MGISKSSGGKYYNLFGQTLEDISKSSGEKYYNLFGQTLEDISISSGEKYWHFVWLNNQYHLKSCRDLKK